MPTTSTAIPPESERQYQSAIVQLARTLGWRVYHSWSSIHSAGGFPDLLLLKGSRCVVAECKAAGGRVMEDQQEWLDAFDMVPCIESYVWRAGTDSLASIAAILQGGN